MSLALLVGSAEAFTVSAVPRVGTNAVTVQMVYTPERPVLQAGDARTFAPVRGDNAGSWCTEAWHGPPGTPVDSPAAYPPSYQPSFQALHGDNSRGMIVSTNPAARALAPASEDAAKAAWLAAREAPTWGPSSPAPATQGAYPYERPVLQNGDAATFAAVHGDNRGSWTGQRFNTPIGSPTPERPALQNGDAPTFAAVHGDNRGSWTGQSTWTGPDGPREPERPVLQNGDAPTFAAVHGDNRGSWTSQRFNGPDGPRTPERPVLQAGDAATFAAVHGDNLNKRW
jgi:hypothetical protein